ncbi:hypothetical protein AAEX28_01985 [Lentisphaerota bacterium WC36G]|nr:hypothetical protein LJT99_04870 [Lentisphaerae bacterium WC36]
MVNELTVTKFLNDDELYDIKRITTLEELVIKDCCISIFYRPQWKRKNWLTIKTLNATWSKFNKKNNNKNLILNNLYYCVDDLKNQKSTAKYLERNLENSYLQISCNTNNERTFKIIEKGKVISNHNNITEAMIKLLGRDLNFEYAIEKRLKLTGAELVNLLAKREQQYKENCIKLLKILKAKLPQNL